jgi:hypothetical protein
MTKIVLVEKSGELKMTNVKELTKDNLYKKCGFKVQNGFEMRHRWTVDMKQTKYNVEVWSKKEGKAGSENKYDLPPPVDKELYFGTMAIVGYDIFHNFVDLDVELWNKIYEHLFGGFEDLDKEEEKSEDELEKIPDNKKTKSGYLKDGFVVEDGDDGEEQEEEDGEDGEEDGDDDGDDEEDGDDDGDDEEDDDDGVSKKRNKKLEDENSYSSSELEEEEYVYTSDEDE